MLDLAQFTLAAGAVGTAAMGIAEGFKSVKMRPIGFSKLEKSINWADAALIKAYGNERMMLLESLYRSNRSSGDLPRILRQGVRIGLDEQNAVEMENILLGADRNQLPAVAKKAAIGKELEQEEQNILGRFEVAADARIDAALSLAERAYINGIRLRAFIIALSLSLSAAFTIKPDKEGIVAGLIVGLVAVPLAPIAKDVADGIKEAAKAIGGKS
ncbi:MAG: hypothetical protein D8M57_19750 [Candidatus Scalindua sp. AMX11]|nr:MAG: hypothetical protein DWQ00_08095 [Candidatus Scalindua sp.]NOG83323.1 hypothetical protein [Planctomycetota bacterium]RZV76777.1 MAG: hypothetical protein EX341_12135 [Candidatus Scalindua sp. SCAELEC01]TDE63159.1 MAG: hypothetical protein D8M57_19750 [Candidatus Scalindua sp. AMX11]GJQ57583.1 MAG: hypothetical protein SCALA701_03840 [Candidatus Scalindua sp.]